MPTVKNVGEPCAREPHARFEVAAGGNQASRLSPRGPGASRRPYRGDFSKSDWADPDIEFVLADGPEPGQWRGVAAMARAWSERLSPFDDYRTTGRDYRMLDGERILVFVAHTGRGKSSGLEVADLGDLGQPAALFHVRDGRVTRLVVYTSRERAFSDLGLEG
jgi:ketosteroid isomerase-like protein